MAYGTYDKEVLHTIHSNAAQETAIALEAATGVKFTYDLVEPITVTRFGIKPTVTFDYDTMTTEAVVKLKRYITYGSSSGAITLATVTLKQGWVAGNVYYVDVPNIPDYTDQFTAVNPADCKAGEQLVVEVTTQGAGGTEAGDWLPYICYNPRAEVAANQAAMHNVTA
jgi:hypothetical protein